MMSGGAMAGGMRASISAVTIVLAIALATASPAVASQPFDGTWTASVACGTGPDGSRGYQWTFSAEVQDGVLRGQYNPPGSVPSGTLTGRIGANGDALLTMRGLTGDPRSSVGGVPRGTRFHFTANAHFAGNTGTGTRNELRQCSLLFRRT
jgi:hypothetical protein